MAEIGEDSKRLTGVCVCEEEETGREEEKEENESNRLGELDGERPRLLRFKGDVLNSSVEWVKGIVDMVDLETGELTGLDVIDRGESADEVVRAATRRLLLATDDSLVTFPRNTLGLTVNDECITDWDENCVGLNVDKFWSVVYS